MEAPEGLGLCVPRHSVCGVRRARKGLKPVAQPFFKSRSGYGLYYSSQPVSWNLTVFFELVEPISVPQPPVKLVGAGESEMPHPPRILVKLLFGYCWQPVP